MKVALLSADIQNPMPNVGDFFITQAVAEALAGHEVSRFPLHQPLTPQTRALLETYDKIVLCGSNLIGSQGTVRTRLEVEDFELMKGRLVPLGLGAQADWKKDVVLDPRGEAILKSWAANGPISVRDELTQRTIEKVLGPGSTRLTGCPSLLWRLPVSPEMTDWTIFTPGPLHYEAIDLRDSVTRWQEKLLNEETIFLAQQPTDLEYPGVFPGRRTFYSPANPALHGRLIAQARRVISFRVHPCLVAISHGVPALLIAVDERTKSLAQMMGIPAVSWNAEVDHESVFADYPWAEIHNRVDHVRREVKQYLLEHGLEKKPAVGKAPSALSVAAIADKKFLSSLIGLLENLHEVHTGPVHAHLLALDEATSAALESRSDVQLYRLSDLWNEHEIPEVMQLSTERRAYVSKARLCREALKPSPGNLLFTDCDMHFLKSPADLGFTAPETSVLFFRHLAHSPVQEQRSGQFNSGLMLVRNGAEPFLDWWALESLRHCDEREGRFYEQAHLDRARERFESIEVYAGYDHNIGAWNYRTVGAHLSPETPGAAAGGNGQTLASIHAAQPDPAGLFSFKATWDQFVSLTRSPTSVLDETPIFYAQANHWFRLKRVMFLYHTLRYRLGYRFALSPWIVRWAVVGWGRHPLLWAAIAYRFFRDRKRRPVAYHPEKWLDQFVFSSKLSE